MHGAHVWCVGQCCSMQDRSGARWWKGLGRLASPALCFSASLLLRLTFLPARLAAQHEMCGASLRSTACRPPLPSLLRHLAVPFAAEQEVREVIARYDVNGDGIIDYSEFLKVGAGMRSTETCCAALDTASQHLQWLDLGCNAMWVHATPCGSCHAAAACMLCFLSAPACVALALDQINACTCAICLLSNLREIACSPCCCCTCILLRVAQLLHDPRLPPLPVH